MKTRILITICLLMFFIFSISSRDATQNASEKETLTIWSTSDVRELTAAFIQEYSKLHPDMEFKMMPYFSQEFGENLNKIDGLALISEDSDVLPNDYSFIRMVVGRDVIVPVMNAANPYYILLEQKGAAVKDFRKTIVADNPDWGIFLGNEANEVLQFYLLDDEVAQSAIFEFLNFKPDVVALTNVATKSSKDVIRFVQKDKYAIGFCRLADLTDIGQQETIKDLKLLPIDKNGNGRVDYHEKIYGTLTNLERGIWLGKYPQTLIRNLYSVSSRTSENENATEFLTWLVTNGQQFMESGGFNELVFNERQSKLEKLHPQQLVLENPEVNSAKAKTFFYIAIGIITTAILAGITISVRNKKTEGDAEEIQESEGILNERVLSFPDGLYFDKSHTWVFMEKDGTVKLGIDDFLQHVTGDYTGLIMKNPGEEITKNEPAFTLVQEGKKISIKAPVSGEVMEFNEDLVIYPSIINNSPYSWGWIYIIKPTNWLREISFLKMAESYKEWIKTEIYRLKDFILGINLNLDSANQVVYQEGGELVDNVLKEFEPNVWEDFQNQFLD